MDVVYKKAKTKTNENKTIKWNKTEQHKQIQKQNITRTEINNWHKNKETICSQIRKQNQEHKRETKPNKPKQQFVYQTKTKTNTKTKQKMNQGPNKSATQQNNNKHNKT